MLPETWLLAIRCNDPGDLPRRENLDQDVPRLGLGSFNFFILECIEITEIVNYCRFHLNHLCLYFFKFNRPWFLTQPLLVFRVISTCIEQVPCQK